MKRPISLLAPLVIWLFIGCGSQPNSGQLPGTTSTVDPCSSDHLPATIQKFNDFTREFDDAVQLASNLPVQQLPDTISNMQRIRRAVEDLDTPSCVTALRTHQLNYMNGMIQTFLAFVGGAEQASLSTGLTLARQEHELYSLEVVRLLGITLAPETAVPPSLGMTETPAPTVTP